MILRQDDGEAGLLNKRRVVEGEGWVSVLGEMRDKCFQSVCRGGERCRLRNLGASPELRGRSMRKERELRLRCLCSVRARAQRQARPCPLDPVKTHNYQLLDLCGCIVPHPPAAARTLTLPPHLLLSPNFFAKNMSSHTLESLDLPSILEFAIDLAKQVRFPSRLWVAPLGGTRSRHTPSDPKLTRRSLSRADRRQASSSRMDRLIDSPIRSASTRRRTPPMCVLSARSQPASSSR